MELTNEFRVGVPIDTTWAVLTDVERIAPCMPGAELQEIEGDEYRGVVKVKVGPITAQYKGTAKFLEQDDAGYRAVLRAEGRETRGQGNANATITATLVADGDGTNVTVVTDLAITGRVAQFGRGVLADVSSKLLGQFVDCLESNVLVADAAPAAAGGGAASAEEGGPADVVPAATPVVPAAAASAEPAPAAEPAWSPAAASPGAAAEAVDAAAAAPSPNGDSSRPEVRRISGPVAEPVNLLDTAGMPVVKRALPLLGVLVVLLWLLRRRGKK